MSLFVDSNRWGRYSLQEVRTFLLHFATIQKFTTQVVLKISVAILAQVHHQVHAKAKSFDELSIAGFHIRL